MTTPHLRASHAFTSRVGGVSAGPFAGLNLDDRQDEPGAVAENRRRLTSALGFTPEQVSRLDQVHGTRVVQARPGVQQADAQVTDQRGVLLAIGTADCYPVLLEDPEAGVLGAAHAGWRGTAGDVVGRAVQAMQELGARPERVRAAVGPGISAARYPVGTEVAGAFEEAGLGAFVGEPLLDGTRPLDLCAANLHLLRQAGVPEGQLWASGRCSTGASFYSYRRDAGLTGRMWAVIGYPSTSGGQA
ncbi:peptidoglycan editing factor PgeF [Deinococcus sp.]|uniref:peptidoglycan editing factor PgeF n=1 Tax=Deinococcus sp. TaxID=47478 RepID=UPI003C7C0C27